MLQFSNTRNVDFEEISSHILKYFKTINICATGKYFIYVMFQIIDACLRKGEQNVRVL